MLLKIMSCICVSRTIHFMVLKKLACVDIAKCQAKFCLLFHSLHVIEKFSGLGGSWNQPYVAHWSWVGQQWARPITEYQTTTETPQTQYAVNQIGSRPTCTTYMCVLRYPSKSGKATNKVSGSAQEAFQGTDLTDQKSIMQAESSS